MSPTIFNEPPKSDFTTYLGHLAQKCLLQRSLLRHTTDSRFSAFKGYITLAKQLAILFIEGFTSSPSESVSGFWKAACVLSLSYTGLGAIGWFVKAHEKFLMSGKDFLKKISIPALGPFIVEYVHLSSTAMPIATCLFVALSASNTSLTDELWDIVSLSRISKIDMATGFAMAEIFLRTRTENGWAESLDAQSNAFQQKLKAEGMNFLTNARKALLDKAKAATTGVSVAAALNVPPRPANPNPLSRSLGDSPAGPSAGLGARKKY